MRVTFGTHRIGLAVACCLVACAAVLATAGEANAQVNQISVVAIYHDTNGAFGIAYDPVNDLIHYSQGDSGDSLVHTLTPFKNLPDNPGVDQISLVAGSHDVAGTTSPGGLGGGGFGGGAYFSALAWDESTSQLVQTSSGAPRRYDPFTAANETTVPGIGSGFADGLDFDGPTAANKWFSGDVQDINNNGVQVVPAAVLLASWVGLGSTTSFGFSGVEQVGSQIFAVAVMSGADTGQSRTIARFDATTGALLGYDPDGDPVAARWEDLAFDGTYLYAADLRGNADGSGPNGDIYVFGISGPGGVGGGDVPEPTTLLVWGGLIALSGTLAWRKHVRATR
jgi:hypothetical protein